MWNLRLTPAGITSFIMAFDDPSHWNCPCALRRAAFLHLVQRELRPEKASGITQQFFAAVQLEPAKIIGSNVWTWSYPTPAAKFCCAIACSSFGDRRTVASCSARSLGSPVFIKADRQFSFSAMA